LTLWAHAPNEPATRLFEAAGFLRAGRSSLDSAGERMLHFEYLSEPAKPQS